MKILVPTDFNIARADAISCPGAEIIFYGRRTFEIVGCTQTLFLKNDIDPDFDAIAGFISHVRKTGRGFYYLLDGLCLNNIEIERVPRRLIDELLGRVAEAGAEGVILSSPMLHSIVKSKFPGLKVVISPAIRINSFLKTSAIVNCGVDGVVFSFDVTRDDGLLKMAAEEFPGIMKFIYVNGGCDLRSVNCVRHLAELSHFSQFYDNDRTDSFDLGGLRCAIDKLERPETHLGLSFVTPERLREIVSLYPSLGCFITDSDATFDSVGRVFDAYFRGAPLSNVFSVVKKYSCLKTVRFDSLSLSPEKAAGIFSERLAVRKKCETRSCGECGACLDFFRGSVRYDEAERKAALEELKLVEVQFSY